MFYLPPTLVPEDMDYCIAGGWAVCPALATDVDIWIHTREGKSVVEELDYVMTHLNRWAALGTLQVMPVRNSGYMISTSPDVLHIADVEVEGNPLGFQIMITKLDTLQLLDTFDLSVCKVAVTRSGDIIRGADWTAPGQHIRCRTDPNHPYTKRRLEKYTHRFGITTVPRATSFFEVETESPKSRSFRDVMKKVKFW